MTDLPHNGHVSAGREDPLRHHSSVQLTARTWETRTVPRLNVSSSFWESHCIALAEILVPKFRSNGDGAPPFQKNGEVSLRKPNLCVIFQHACFMWLAVLSLKPFHIFFISSFLSLLNLPQSGESVDTDNFQICFK